MVTVSIKDEYIEVLSALGDLQESMDLALKQYTLDKIAVKIAELRHRDIKYQEKYQLDYSRFCQKIYEDEEFLQQIENSVDKTWEIDLADWEFCHKGVEDWIEKLQTILLTYVKFSNCC
ncbi:hypothetical protein SR1949_26920 [Sphaerospermopsis reniformis]|uniref:Uncharacterized protein n=3 Tax=Sphaerospermopsis TaxID=752201 RepID=A0A480A2P4_9CYAN|nr:MULTISPECIES: hypothetical protein [Sphaerospermopsis]MBC5795295.1 hypothetical protein [Sphaerospermopsis sp. LEGE 00249]BAZ79098.1 hypothetical protein NIES73_03380 [Sphaerospermopsis kisseleviana NIES-73]GCL37581.1 hypothetical protein SR1949_26920 [Sphaerospermopsis reniformis]